MMRKCYILTLLLMALISMGSVSAEESTTKVLVVNLTDGTPELHSALYHSGKSSVNF